MSPILRQAVTVLLVVLISILMIVIIRDALQTGNLQESLHILGIALGIVLLSLLPPALLIGVPALVLAWRIRRLRGMLILLHLERAASMNLPMHEALHTFGRAEPGRLHRRMLDVGHSLERGAALAPSLQAFAPEVTRRDRQIIAAGEQAGRLLPVLRRLLNQRRFERQLQRIGQQDAVPIAICTLVALLVVSSAAMVFTIPKYEKIVEDFGTVLPPLTRGVLDLQRWFTGRLHPMQTLPGFMWILLSIGLAVGGWFALRGTVRGRALLDRLYLVTPLLGRLTSWRGLAAGFAIAEESLRAGDGLPPALRHAGTAQANTALAVRFRNCAVLLEGGEDIHRAAQQARLPSVVASLWAAAQPAGNLPGVMHFLSEFYQHRAQRLGSFFHAAWLPAVTLAVGIPVGLYVYALFLPLIHLIELTTVTSGSF